MTTPKLPLLRHLPRIGAALVLVSLTYAASLTRTEPSTVGLSTDRLARITAAMESDVAAGRIAGAVSLVARNGQVAYFEARGKADRERGVAMRPDTIFRIYSMSKPITSAALMMLYEEGRFRLSDPVAKYLPEFENVRVLVDKKAGERGGSSGVGNLLGEREEPEISPDEYDLVKPERPMTVQDLMRHTSGLTYGFSQNDLVDRMYRKVRLLDFNKTLAEATAKLATLPLKHHPGTQFEYSVSVDVQGRLIEVLSGMPFDQFLQQRVFDPLQMPDTGFYAPEPKWDRLAQIYQPLEGGAKIKAREGEFAGRFKEKPALLSGGGGMVSTTSDYLRFCQMMLNGGEFDGVRLLSRKTVELMTIDHLAATGVKRNNGYGFGLGFAVANDLARGGSIGSIGEYNWGGAAGTRFWIDPQEKMIGIYMLQILPHDGLLYGDVFKRLAYQAIVN
jgi:CubicO group peptidase (beta-lactamase class C family)